MPGELSNCVAGRVANLFNLHGPNFTVDAACASALAAMDAAVDGLVDGEYDVAVTGGIDRNMGASTFIKFCAIGALSATGTRPVRGRRRRLRDGRGRARCSCSSAWPTPSATATASTRSCAASAASSDGKGKGITAPNPVGQKLAVERAWRNAGLSPAAVHADRGPRHVDARRRRRRARQPRGGVRRRGAGPRLDRARLGQVQHRPPQGRGGRRRTAQDRRWRCTTRCCHRA